MQWQLHGGKGSIEHVLHYRIVGESDEWGLYLQIVAIRAQHYRVIIHNFTKEVNTAVLGAWEYLNHIHPNTIILRIKGEILQSNDHH